MVDNKYGYIKDKRVFRSAFLEFPERVIGEVKVSEAESLNYFVERFNLASSEVEEVKAKIEAAENKGSYLMKVLHLKDTLFEFDAIGDFASLYQQLDKLHFQLQTIITNNRHKNLQVKTALLEELRVVAKSSDWKAASAAVKEIQTKWIRTGAIEEDKRVQIEGDFKTLTDTFYERKASFYEDLNQMMAQKEEDFKRFISDTSKKLEKIDSSRKLQHEIKSTVEAWKGLGKIERSKHNLYWQELQNVFKAQINRLRKFESKQRNQSAKETIELKQKILDQLEVSSKDLLPKLELKEIKETWKKAGRLPKKVDLEFGEKYRFLIDVIAEKQFLHQLANKKGGNSLSELEKSKLRIKLMYDLLKRDQTELRNFEENLGKFNTSTGLTEMLDAKLNQQKRKVEVKKLILNELKTLK